MKLSKEAIEIIATKAGFTVKRSIVSYGNYITSDDYVLDEHLSNFATLAIEEYIRQSRTRGIS